MVYIKFIVILSLLLVSSLCYSKELFLYQKVYKQLASSNNISIPYKLERKDTSYTDGRSIHIGTEDIDLCRNNEGCIAWFIAHEMSHVILKHYLHSPSAKKEKIADIYAAKVLSNSGYDPCSGITYMNYLLQDQGNYTDKDHPSPKQRLYYITSTCHKYITNNDPITRIGNNTLPSDTVYTLLPVLVRNYPTVNILIAHFKELVYSYETNKL